MLRVSRMTDYGIVLLGHLAGDFLQNSANTRELAARSGLPMSTVSKVLKMLARQGLLVSQRGAMGGYQLARSPELISLAEIYSALEGPIAVTQGSVDAPETCSIGANWQLINDAVAMALRGISLVDLTAAWRQAREKGSLA